MEKVIRAIIIPMPTVLGKIDLNAINNREKKASQAKRVFINESREKAEEFNETLERKKKQENLHRDLVNAFKKKPGATLTDTHGHLVIKLS